MNVVLTGAGGFIGSHCVKYWLENTDWNLILLDRFRNKGTISRLMSDGVIKEEHADRVKLFVHDLRVPIDPYLESELIGTGKIDVIVSMASDSSVAHSIKNPRGVWEGNTAIASTMLEFARSAAAKLDSPPVFLNIGTDEVYGEYMLDGDGHTEGDPFNPSNVYAASKAAQEMLCYAYWKTFNIPVLLTNTMNNFGERQDVEKFIPRVIKSLLEGSTVQVYTDETGKPGSRVYLHCEDHAHALMLLIEKYCKRKHLLSTRSNESPVRYNICGSEELNNYEVVEQIMSLIPNSNSKIEFVKPNIVRPGYDRRYLLSPKKMATMFGEQFKPQPFSARLEQVVNWTLRNQRFLEENPYE